MLDVLLREEIHDAVVVVTRYFGGTLLGTGGLVRAYQKATQEGLANSVVIEKQQGERLKVQASYQEVGKLQYVLGQNGIPIIDSVYAQDVELHGVVSKEQTAKIEKELLEATNGKARIIWEEAVEYALVDKELKLF